MPMLNSAAKLLLKPVPRFISARAHAVVDYVTIGSFLASAAWLWSRNKRAALAALVCGGAELAVVMLTSYPGGSRKVVSFHRHGQIDVGLAAMTATMPEFFAFQNEPSRKFFIAQGALIAAVHELTEFPAEPSFMERVTERTRAA